MAAVARSYTPGDIFQNPVDVFVDITAPTSSLTPTADANTLLIVATAGANYGLPTSATGYHVGSVDGPTSISFTEKVNEIWDDQHESPIDAGFDSVDAEIDFNMKETNFSKLQKAFTSDDLGAYTSLAATEVLQIGGQFSSSKTLRSLLLVSQRRDVAGKFLYVMAYKTYLKSAIQMTFIRSKEIVYKLKFGVVADLSRVQGDELMQIVRTK